DDTLSGEAGDPAPLRVPSCVTDVSAPAADVAWTVPSGNLKPPADDSTEPLTVSLDVGALVAIPTFPFLSSSIPESPIDELPSHFANLPVDPPPVTVLLAALAALPPVNLALLTAN